MISHAQPGLSRLAKISQNYPDIAKNSHKIAKDCRKVDRLLHRHQDQTSFSGLYWDFVKTSSGLYQDFARTLSGLYQDFIRTWCSNRKVILRRGDNLPTWSQSQLGSSQVTLTCGSGYCHLIDIGMKLHSVHFAVKSTSASSL